MASLKFALGLIPSTAKFEKSENKIRKEYQEYKQFENSEELKHFYELEKEVTSPDFARRKKEIFKQKFKDTDEYKKLLEYKRLKKSGSIKNYFKVDKSQKLKNYQAFVDSELVKQIDQLEKQTQSDEHKKAKSELSSKEFKKSEHAAREKEYKKLLKSPQYKRNKRFEKSKAYLEYKKLKDSEQLKKYNDLKDFTESKEFKDKQAYMKLSGKKKYELSSEHKKEVEYNELKSSEKFKWYFKLKKKYPFKKLDQWKLVFEDLFESPQPDEKKWMFRYINADATIKKPYVLGDDLHAFTDGKNIEINGGKLKIITRKEKGKSLAWNPMMGFTEKEFDYTSDLLNSAPSLNRKYGLFTAKVRISPSSVTQAFSLMSDRILPHIDIIKFEKNKIYSGNFWKNGKGVLRSQTRSGGNRFTKDFYIYSLEWTPKKLVWKINGLVFKEETKGIPDKDMHIVFNASLKNHLKSTGIPSSLELDWVRVYEPIN